MPGMPGRTTTRAASPEIWAARAWNVFNEGRPFSIVYPLLVLLAAARGRAGAGRAARAGAASRPPRRRWCSSRFSFALRGRALLWLAALAAVPLLEPWRAPALLAGALAGYAFFTVVVWGSRLLPPAHGRAVDQRPALLAAGAHELRPDERERAGAGAEAADRAERGDPAGGGADRRLASLARRPRWRSRPALGALAARRFAKRLPAYPEREPRDGVARAARLRPARAARVRDRRRRLQPGAALAGGCSGRWTGSRGRAPSTSRVEPAYPARTVVCFSSMLTGAHAGRARHALELRAAARRAARVGLRRARARTAAAAGSSGSRTCWTRSARTWSAP